MKLNFGHPFWLDASPWPQSFGPLTDNLQTQVAIIGGGISGALIAWHLVEAGIETVLVDKGLLAHGSTAASTALLQYEIDTPLCELVELVGERHAQAAYRLCNRAIDQFASLVATLRADCSFEPKSSVQIAGSEADAGRLRAECEARRRMGLDVEYLDRHELQKLFAFSRHAALFSRTAGQVDAMRLTRALIEAAQHKGLRIFANTSITRCEPSSCGLTLWTQRGHRIRARDTIFATGYESQRFLGEKVAELKITYALASEPLPDFNGWHEQSLLWDSEDPYHYLRTTADGRALIGGADESFSEEAADAAPSPEKIAALKAYFTALFPHLPFNVAYAWSGVFGETKDGLAYIGNAAEFPHAWFALGYGGNGMNFSLVAAEAIRDALLGHRHEALDIFRFGR